MKLAQNIHLLFYESKMLMRRLLASYRSRFSVSCLHSLLPYPLIEYFPFCVKNKNEKIFNYIMLIILLKTIIIIPENQEYLQYEGKKLKLH